MDRSHLIILRVFLSAIILIIAVSQCVQRQQSRDVAISRGWTPALEKQMYDMFFEQAAKLTPDDGLQRSYAVCCVAKMKELFPKGIGSITPETMTDSVRMAVMKMGAECASSITGGKAYTWTPDELRQLKLPMYSYPETKDMSDSAKQDYVDCIALKITSKFSDGIDKVNKEDLKKIIENARNECFKMVSNKYKSVSALEQREFIRLLKAKLYTFSEVKSLPESERKTYVDCVASKLIARFPNGIAKQNKDSLKQAVTRARVDCLIPAK